ncbi:holo-ACP synthase [Salinispira pacifica]|uniref:Holo-[acyl-carrier-protein] synthase n=1 Tax=Salinispira pacifica TaxID=1307761 RepID=V5WIU9_9SPIO|nr:holo-ACP synthase [Salinispira pacifica]AHC15767.1 Holo-[acyl-carrier protein] synthase [Salinispira pacifica]
MIRGIGVDIVRVERMISWLERPEMMARFFTSREISWVLSQGEGAAASLAARFAAREALGKALGTGLRDLRLKDLEICRDDQGKPAFCPAPRAQDQLDSMGISSVHVSLSHERDYAVAMVVIE